MGQEFEAKADATRLEGRKKLKMDLKKDGRGNRKTEEGRKTEGRKVVRRGEWEGYKGRRGKRACGRLAESNARGREKDER